MSQNKAALTIALYRNRFGNPVPHVQLFSHDAANCLVGHVEATFKSDIRADLLSSDNRLVGDEHLGHRMLDRITLLLSQVHALTKLL